MSKFSRNFNCSPRLFSYNENNTNNLELISELKKENI